MNVNVFSEIGQLEGVIIHQPGPEIENMTPVNAERALYSDILNLPVAAKDYTQFEGVLMKVTKTFDVVDLLAETLNNEKVKRSLVNKICINEKAIQIADELISYKNHDLARVLLEGVEMKKNNLTRFLNDERYLLRPLHNFFFTRDASISMGNDVVIGKMASKVRARESRIMEAIFDYNPRFKTNTLNPTNYGGETDKITIEGGDVLIAREDVLVIGLSQRTTSQGIDFIIDRMKEKKETRHIIVQELPHSPESFIHLDMVFTFLDVNKCMAYEPLIIKPNKYQTVHIKIDNGKVTSIKNEKNLLIALNNLGFELEPVKCGENKDPWIQEREQWHSGANFFAFAPGKLLGYGRNFYTLEAMHQHGFEILKAVDVINNKINLDDYKKCVVTIEGSELARGGGGARCMTMPVARKAVNWK